MSSRWTVALVAILFCSTGFRAEAGCLITQCATLVYFSTSGDVIVDGRTESAAVWVYTLRTPATPTGFRPAEFRSPFGNTLSQEIASTTFIGDFDPDEIGEHWLPLGTVFPAGLNSADSVRAFLTTASYATTANDDERTLSVLWWLPGDLDRDRDVDSNDLLSILGGWTGALTEPSDRADFTTGDMDFDFDVDSADFLSFLGGWTGARVATASTAIVAEPVSGSSLGIAVLALLAWRRQIWRARSHRA